MGVEKIVGSVFAAKKISMLFVLHCFYSWYDGNTVLASSGCNTDGCTQTCFEDDCRNVCHPDVKQCMQKGYGYTKSSIMLCQAWKLCTQMCSDGQCMFSCDQSRKCIQECYGKHCTATCNDGNGACEQQCFSGNCSMTCNSPNCSQQCHVNDCRATCAHGVEECTQLCYVEKCDFSCSAKKCISVDLKGKKSENIWNDKEIIIATASSASVVVILIIIIITLFVKYRRRKKSDEDRPLLDQQEPVYEDVETLGEAEPNQENNASSNANRNFENTSQRIGVDSSGYSMPYADNEEYTIPHSGEPHVHATGADEVHGVDDTRPQNSVVVVENSVLGDKKSSEEEDSTDDGIPTHVVTDLEEIQTEARSEDETSKESAHQGSSTSKATILDDIPQASHEPEIEVLKKISPQSPSDGLYSNGALQNDSGSDDIVLVYVLPNSDQKPEEERQSEAGEAAIISVENSRLQPSNGELEDDNSTDDVALVYIEHISDEPEPATCSQCITNEEPSTVKFDGISNVATIEHGRNARNDVTADGVSQASGGGQGDDVANDGGNVPGYQALNQKKREIEEKSRYQKLIKRKVA